MSQWTFLTNHAIVLSYISRRASITGRELSLEIGITERAIRKIISDLEGERYITKAKEGRRVRYSINPRLPLRHKTQKDKMVGDFLHFLGWKIKQLEGKGRESQPKSKSREARTKKLRFLKNDENSCWQWDSAPAITI